MTLVRLHNDDWGYESNCFVCEERNEGGLRLRFFHEHDPATGRDVVVAEFSLPDRFSGAPTMVHGGVTLAILDEAMAWACIAVGHRWAVTTETSTRFDRPVRVGSHYRVEAEVVDHVDATMRTAATIVDRRGGVRAEAAASFTTLGEAQAVRLAGVDLGDEHRAYLDR
ncbi:MAG: PaaI family thioesterase [Ilumatobacter sp.]|uniref:PaaI family thioesterase n=1 Tax=Ilumatobacter sp. TaxID=1967498 RepID=UPI00262FEC3E|nr:PaaI family thioesterase [Ilumatobacter sp.]MDJ0770465.1 PaaI family thioesterase [Ilumatobacter sp.]